MRILREAEASGYADSFDGTPIYWERHGPTPEEAPDKTPMFFCYGLVCSVNQWRKQVERYRHEHPIFLFDYRAHHQSGHPSDKAYMNLSALARDLHAIFLHQKIKKPAHVWGHSMGCHVALEFALAFPELCKSLVLCCGTPNSPFNNMFGHKVTGQIGEKLFDWVGKYPDPFFKTWDFVKSKSTLTEIASYLAGFNTDTSTKEDIRAYAHAVSDVDSEVFFSLLSDMGTEQIKNVLPKIATPSIVIAGALDRVTPPSEQHELASLLQKSEYVEIPAGSHNVQLDFGEYVGLKVEDFWRRHNLF